MSSRTYRQACNVAKALDLVGERWTLLIIRDLLLGPLGYNALLAGLPGLTTNLLAKRLKSLAEQGLIEKGPASTEGTAKALYSLTTAGRELGPVLAALSDWGQAHAPPPLPTDQVNIRLLLIVLGRHYEAHGRRWIVQLDGETASLQFRLGGDDFEGVEGTPMRPDLTIGADPMALRELLFGEQAPSQLVESGRITLSGPGPELHAIWDDFLASFKLNASEASA